MNSLISIIIPAFNQINILRKNIASILQPETANIHKEIIIVDDCSNQMLSILKEEFPEIIYIRNHSNKGPAASRNIGIKEARGDVLLFIDSDVIINGKILEKVNTFFQDPNNYALVGNVSIDNLGKGLVSDFYKLQINFNFNACKDDFFTTFNTEFGAIRKSIIDQIGLFNESYLQADIEDYEFGSRISAHFKIILDNSIEIEHNFNSSISKALIKFFRRAFLWQKVFLQKKTFENVHVTKKRAYTVFLAFVCLNLLFLSLLLHNIQLEFITSDQETIFKALSIIQIIFGFQFIILNRNFYSFVSKQTGIIFLIKAILFDFVASYMIGLGSAIGMIYYSLKNRFCRTTIKK